MREVIATGKTVEEAMEAGCKELGLSRDEVRFEIIEMQQKKLFRTIPAKVKVIAAADLEAAAQAAQPTQEPAKIAQPEAKQAAAPDKEKPAKIENKSVKNTAVKTEVLEKEPAVAIDLSAEPAVQKAVDYLSGIFAAIGVPDFEVKAFHQGDATLLTVDGNQITEYMHVDGDSIQALSYLTDRAVNKGVDKKEHDYLRVRLDVAGFRNRREKELIEIATKSGGQVAATKVSITLAPMNPYERLIVHTTIGDMQGVISESVGSEAERRVVIKSTAPDAVDGEDWRPARRNNNNRGGGSRGSSHNNYRNGKKGGSSSRSSSNGGGYKGKRNSFTPEREFASRPTADTVAPVVPQRREAIKDGEDLPLYGKIEV